jgi:hypothetical protein
MTSDLSDGSNPIFGNEVSFQSQATAVLRLNSEYYIRPRPYIINNNCEVSLILFKAIKIDG